MILMATEKDAILFINFSDAILLFLLKLIEQNCDINLLSTCTCETNNFQISKHLLRFTKIVTDFVPLEFMEVS